MYRLILVDDEAIIRDGISSCIPWEKNGFSLVGVFEHGLQALEYLRKNPVDVVISDINMPRMDGLELSSHICKEFPGIAVLILTGYDEFEYAQEAVRYHVKEFLLKPITAEELGSVLTQVRKELDIQRRATEQQELMRDKLEQSFPLLRQKFMHRLLCGTIDQDLIELKKEYYQWHNLGKSYQVIVFGLPATWNELDCFSFSERLKQDLTKYDDIIPDKEENVIILLQGDEPASLHTRTEELAKKAFLEISSMKKDQISAGVGQVVDALQDIKISFEGASHAMDYSRVIGLSQIISIDQLRKRKTVSPEGFNIISSRLINELKGGEAKETQAALQVLFAYLEQHYLTMPEASSYLIRLYSMLMNFLMEMELFPDTEDIIPLHYQGTHSLIEARAFFEQMIQNIEEHIRKKRHELMQSRVQRARSIIEDHYMDPDFSLSKMCDMLFLSSSQFSVLFKEGTGQTFIEYLTSHRMIEAKRLLKTTDMKSYEIAEKVGYQDPRYFSLLFKKHTNKTPMEYRKSLEP